MEKMGLIQTCWNNRLLQANPACFTHTRLFSVLQTQTRHSRGFGCVSLGTSKVTLGKPAARIPQGVGAQWPPKRANEQEGEESVHFHKGPLRGKSQSWVVKAVTKPPAIISLVLAAGGCTHTAVCSASSASQQHHAPQEPRTKTTDRRTVVH